MRDVKAAATNKTSAGAGGAAAKAPTSAKKDRMQGEGFAEQEQSLAPGGAADRATMAGLQCGERTRFGAPGPFAWSLSYTCAAMMGPAHESKGRQTVQDSFAPTDVQLLGQTDAAEFIYGNHTRQGDEPAKRVCWEFNENLAHYKDAKTQMKNSQGVRGVKDHAPSATNKTTLERC